MEIILNGKKYDATTQVKFEHNKVELSFLSEKDNEVLCSVVLENSDSETISELLKPKGGVNQIYEHVKLNFLTNLSRRDRYSAEFHQKLKSMFAKFISFQPACDSKGNPLPSHVALFCADAIRKEVLHVLNPDAGWLK